jgi:hypothetical protein
MTQDCEEGAVTIEGVRQMTGYELLEGRGLAGDDLSVLAFWRWAYSDLMANNVRGVFAEWLVSRILGVQQPVRDSWQAWDLKIGNVKIEVKCSAYLQTWHDKESKESKITFTGLKAREWIGKKKRYSESDGFNADIYVFCLHTGRDREQWSATNLDQWKFYVLDKPTLQAANFKSLTLSRVMKLGGTELDAASLRTAVNERLRRYPGQVSNGISSARAEIDAETVILEVGGEGGSIKLLGKESDKGLMFKVSTGESGLLDDDQD